MGAREVIRAGQPPLWTPHVMSGYPLLSMSQLAVGYPLTWGYLVLPGYVAETIYVLAPFLLAPAFTYAYARQIGRSRAASLVAALAFGWGGGVANRLAHSGIMTNALVWLPLALVAVERARTRPFAKCLVGATAAYTMSVLSGHGQGFVYVGALLLVYSAFLSLSTAAARGEPCARRGRARWRPLAVGAGALACGAGLCAFQIMETLRAARRSVRDVISYESFAGGAFTPRQVFESLALPLFSKGDVAANVAPLAVALALAGAWLALRRDARLSDPRPLFWLCVAVASFVLMIGDATPLYRLAYYTPVVNRFRVPARHSFEWTFSLAALAAYGFDLVAAKTGARAKVSGARAQSYRRAAALTAVALTAAVGYGWYAYATSTHATATAWSQMTEGECAAWKGVVAALTILGAWLCLGVRAPRWRARVLALALAVAFCLEPFICYSLWWRYVRKPASRFSTESALTKFMRERAPEENRVYSRVKLFADETIIPSRVDAPDLSAAYGLRDVAGYEPLTLTRYSRALADDYDDDAAPPRPDPPPDPSIFGERSRVLDILNATYVAVMPAANDDDGARALLRPDSPAPVSNARWEPVYDADGLVVVRNRNALPRAWLVAEAESVDGEQALRRIRGGGAFDPRRTALLEDAPAELPPLPGGSLTGGSTARVAAYEPNRIVVETDAQTPTVLVLSEIFYPGWEASVDGRAERVRLTDYLLRGVAVPAGRHRVEMRYAAPQARNGAMISALTLAALAALCLASRRRARARR
ncbi:MAG: YfhO family protein [Acidobacteria bacterium]|nr:YfhO family protein [Acidobacteriota bacterium]